MIRTDWPESQGQSVRPLPHPCDCAGVVQFISTTMTVAAGKKQRVVGKILLKYHSEKSAYGQPNGHCSLSEAEFGCPRQPERRYFEPWLRDCGLRIEGCGSRGYKGNPDIDLISE